MEHFTLIGYPTLAFETVWRGKYAGIDCVKGVSLDRRRQTLARVADVRVAYPHEFYSHVALFLQNRCVAA